MVTSDRDGYRVPHSEPSEGARQLSWPEQLNAQYIPGQSV